MSGSVRWGRFFAGFVRGSGSRRGPGRRAAAGRAGISPGRLRGCRADAAASRPEPVFPARAVVLHIGEGRPRGSTPSFPHDYGVFLECWFSVGGLPCAERALSAHGRISTALSAGEFPRDSADPSPAGPGRMCSTAPARPMPRIRARRPRPDTADPHPPRTRPSAPSHRSRPIPGSLRRERLGDPGRARRSIRWAAAGFTSTSLNPRARHLTHEIVT